MIDHVTIKVSDVEKSKKFYEEVFSSLGYKIAFGVEGDFYAFEIGGGLFEIIQSPEKKVLTTSHIALRGDSKEDVEAFHKAGLEAGGKDNGKPGLRTEYTPNYYAAFILDPDGHNIEIMTD